MSQQETARQEFERLCAELNVSPYHSEMTRERFAKLGESFWIQNPEYDRERLMAMIDARTRMEREASASKPQAADAPKPGRMHPLWVRSNERLLVGRVSDGDDHGRL